MFNWNMVDYETYKSIKNKSISSIYFITDGPFICVGDKKFTGTFELVNDLPKVGLKDVLYINKNTYSVDIWNGIEYKSIIPKIETSIEDGTASSGLVTGDVVKKYITNKLDSLSKNKANKTIYSDDILLSRDIVVNKDTGSYKKGDIIKRGTSITDIIIKQLVDRTLPLYTKPKLFLRPGSKVVEVGSILNPTITGEFERNDAGELTKYTLVRDEKGKISTVVDDTNIRDYVENPFMVSEGECMKFTATAKYDDGIIKQDNIGTDSPDQQIKAGTLTAELTITGKRNLFYETLTDPISLQEITSGDIRGFKYKLLDPKEDTRFEIDILPGTKQIVFAYPANLRSPSSVTSKLSDSDVMSSFSIRTMSIPGANNFQEIDYKVFSYTPKKPIDEADTYIVII